MIARRCGKSGTSAPLLREVKRSFARGFDDEHSDVEHDNADSAYSCDKGWMPPTVVGLQFLIEPALKTHVKTVLADEVENNVE